MTNNPRPVIDYIHIKFKITTKDPEERLNIIKCHVYVWYNKTMKYHSAISLK